MDLFNLTHHRIEIADLVATVTISNPPVNAQNDLSQEELIYAMD